MSGFVRVSSRILRLVHPDSPHKVRKECAQHLELEHFVSGRDGAFPSQMMNCQEAKDTRNDEVHCDNGRFEKEYSECKEVEVIINLENVSMIFARFV